MVRRRNERGAAVFIVVMVMTLLTALGVFAVRSASLADLAAGYEREGAQAALVAEYAVTSTAAYLGNPATADLLMRQYKESELNQSSLIGKCQANALATAVSVGTRAPGCATVNLKDIQDSVALGGNEVVFAPPNLPSPGIGATSSLNASETTSAAFVVELTESGETGVLAPGGGTYVSMTATALAQVRPTGACAGALAPAAGQQAMRAILSVTKITK